MLNRITYLLVEKRKLFAVFLGIVVLAMAFFINKPLIDGKLTGFNMEENPFWAATNSIAYIYLLSRFIQKTKDEAVNGHFVDALFHTAIQPDAEAVKIILLNMRKNAN